MSRTVYVAMVGDMLHAGHITILDTARGLGEVTVGLITDEAALRYKRLPFLPYEDRARVLRSLRGITRIVPQDTLSYERNLRAYRPHYVVHGDDWRSGLQAATRRQVIDILAEWGGELVEIPYTAGISSTLLHQANQQDGVDARLRQGRLRRLLGSARTLRIIEAHGAFPAAIAERARSANGRTGFDAFWHGCRTDRAMRGKPDGQVVDTAHRLQTVDEILACTRLPLVYEAEGGGTPAQVRDLAHRLDRAGISAACLNGQADPMPVLTERIAAFRAACPAGDPMHISSLGSASLDHGMDAALKHAQALEHAGTDAFLIEGAPGTAERVLAFCQHMRSNGGHAPVLVIPAPDWTTPFAAYERHGVAGVIYPDQLLRSIEAPVGAACERILA